jgi:hypothetical protein
LLQPDIQTDGRTGMTKLIVAFRNSANAPINHINVLCGQNVESFNAEPAANTITTGFQRAEKHACLYNIFQVRTGSPVS